MSALKLATKLDHAIKIEDLLLTEKKADQIVSALEDFALELGYSMDRIEPLECRSRDGFSAYSHNKGGLGAVSFVDQYSAYNNGTGFDNCDATLDKYQEYNLEYFIESPETKHLLKDYSNWSEENHDEFTEYCHRQDETVMFGLDMMLSSETELNLRFTVCAKDAPYHRHYDDLISIDIEFKSIADLKKQLKAILKRQEVKIFSDNLDNAY